MADFSLTEVLRATGGHLTTTAKSKLFHGVSTDTRAVEEGNLFIALKGERFDGHDFIDAAINNGAAGVIVSREVKVPEGIAEIKVDNTLYALQDIARFHRERFDIPVIAITGSNGKTTTKDMIAAVLSSRFQVLKTEANYNNEIGLPLTLLKLKPGHEAAVVEMGMRAQGEIRDLAEIALPTVGVITNVGETHMEILGSIENIAAAKAELVQAIGHDDLVILNADDHHVFSMKDKTSGRVVFYGLGSGGVVRAENIKPHEENPLATSFDCVSPRGSFSVILNTVGIHNVYNALAAIAVGWELGLKPSEIKKGITSFVPGSMRLDIKTFGNYTVIDDVYNASPLSMVAALDTLNLIAKGRKVAVLGDMLELGEAAVEAHRRLGRHAAEVGVEAVVTVGELAKEIAEAAAVSGVKTAQAFSNHSDAAAALERIIKPGDYILVKGSRGMKMEKMLEAFEGLR